MALYSSSGDSRRGVGRAAVLTDLRQTPGGNQRTEMMV